MKENRGMYYRPGTRKRRTVENRPDALIRNIKSFMERIGIGDEISFLHTQDQVYMGSAEEWVSRGRDSEGGNTWTSFGGGEIWSRVFIVNGEELLLEDIRCRCMKEPNDAQMRDLFFDILACGVEKRAAAAAEYERSLDNRTTELLRGWQCGQGLYGRRSNVFDAVRLVARFEAENDVKFSVKNYKEVFGLLEKGYIAARKRAWSGLEDKVAKSYVYCLCQAAVDMGECLEDVVTELWEDAK